MTKRLFAPVLLCAVLLYSCTADKIELENGVVPVDTTSVDTTDTIAAVDTCNFSTYVQPIINDNCAFSGCHGSGSANGDFTNYGGIKAKVDDNGKFEKRVIIDSDMPPSSGLSSQAEKDLIQCWLDNGAPNN